MYLLYVRYLWNKEENKTWVLSSTTIQLGLREYIKQKILSGSLQLRAKQCDADQRRRGDFIILF